MIVKTQPAILRDTTGQMLRRIEVPVGCTEITDPEDRTYLYVGSQDGELVFVKQEMTQ